MKNQRSALVTGSSRGIGLGIAREAARRGYHVFLNGREAEPLRAAAAELATEMEGQGGSVSVLPGDATQPEFIETALRAVQERGGLDFLVANVGSGQSVMGWDVPLEEYRRVFDQNYFGAIQLMTAAAKIMKAGSSILAIGSIAGCESIRAPIPYTAAKAALIATTKALSDALAPSGIRVNALSPGNTLAPGGVWERKLRQDEGATRQYIEAEVPLKRFASPDEIARAALFLAEADFVTGHHLVVDGGQVRRLL